MRAATFILPISLFVTLALITGCSTDQPTTQPASAYDRARSDPMNYQPDTEWPDVSGGGIGHLDKKGLKQDLNHVFNP